MPPEPQDNHSGAGDLDLNKILLPKKEIHSVDSAQRIDAGSLYTQEQNATLAGSTPIPPPAPAVPPPAVVKKPEGIGPLQTYQGDIARAVHDQGASVVSIAAAEANRRGASPLSENAPQNSGGSFSKGIFVAVGIVLLVAGAGAFSWFAFFNNAPLPQQAAGVAPFIAIDGTKVVEFPTGIDSASAMNALVQAKNSISLSLGLVAQIYIENAATSTGASVSYTDAPTLLSLITPDMPPTLVRDIEPVYLLGVHSFSVNQPFLILKVDSYEQAYAGMLDWEGTMKQDLAPLFTYVPSPTGHAVQIQAPIATTTASSTDTSATTTTSATLPLVQTGFTDKIVNNHDARVLQNADGTIYFLWTFLDRQTILITTNPDTLKEVVTRLTQAPVTSLPGQ